MSSCLKVSSQSRKFEFNVFSIIHLNGLTFDMLDRFQENKVLQTAQMHMIDNIMSQIKNGNLVTMVIVIF